MFEFCFLYVLGKCFLVRFESCPIFWCCMFERVCRVDDFCNVCVGPWRTRTGGGGRRQRGVKGGEGGGNR